MVVLAVAVAVAVSVDERLLYQRVILVVIGLLMCGVRAGGCARSPPGSRALACNRGQWERGQRAEGRETGGRKE